MDLKIAAVITLSISLAAGMQILFMTHIPDNGVQSDYLIDSYFYMHLGETISRESDAMNQSLYSLSDEYKPNAESQGIILLNAYLYRLLPSWYCLPLFFGLIYFSLFYFLYRVHLFDSTLLLFPFYTLYLHILLPSKETFLLIGFILILASAIKTRYWYMGLVGLGLMLLSRPTAALMFVASSLAWLCARKRTGRYILLLAFVGAYFAYLRLPVFAYSLRQQIIFLLGDPAGEIAFCKVGPIPVCYSSPGTFEIIVALRILTLALVPFKWIWNALQLFYQDYGTLFFDAFYHRVTPVIHMAIAIFIFISRRRTSHAGARVRSLMLCYVALYLGVFATGIYYQPTRQVLIASCFMMLTMSLTSTENLRSNSSSNPTVLSSAPETAA
jgi:hypothetical protein